MRKILGWILLVVGLVLFAIPGVPGLPVIVAGAAILGVNHPAVRGVKAWFQKRGLWPK